MPIIIHDRNARSIERNRMIFKIEHQKRFQSTTNQN